MFHYHPEITSLSGTWIICQNKWDNWTQTVYFLHADEVVYSKLMIIKWLNEGLDDKIFRVLGGCHTLLVKLKIWHKNYGLLGMKDWCFIIMKVLENLTLDDTFTALIGKLRVDPSSVLAESVIAHPNFCNSKSAITATSEPYHPCL